MSNFDIPYAQFLVVERTGRSLVGQKVVKQNSPRYYEKIKKDQTNISGFIDLAPYFGGFRQTLLACLTCSKGLFN